jgi:dihydroorotase
MHLHLRDDKMLQLVAPLSSKYFSGAIIMPNLETPITTKKQLRSYKLRILDAIGQDTFEPMMTLFFKPYSREFLENIKDEITAIKLYPAGITTNSKDGIENIDIPSLKPTLEAMSELNIPLCVHGETNGFVLDREKEFISIYKKLAKAFPKLKIIMEHITTKEAVNIIEKYDNIYATITAHHLLITLDDVVGGMLKPHLFCKPIAKRYEDREALINLATSNCEKVMFGSDSAPHPQSSKENCGCAAGIFTAPIALQILAQLFDKKDKLDRLQNFISKNAQKIYNIKPLEKRITLRKENYKVPQSYSNIDKKVIPIYSQEILSWSIV